jgi:hypothetical protein
MVHADIAVPFLAFTSQSPLVDIMPKRLNLSNKRMGGLNKIKYKKNHIYDFFQQKNADSQLKKLSKKN